MRARRFGLCGIALTLALGASTFAQPIAALAGRHNLLGSAPGYLAHAAQDATPSQEGNPAPALGEPISRFLSHPTLQGARVGVLVRDVESGETLAEHNADELFAPASINKIFVAAAALWRLGAAFTWQTPLTYRGRRSGVRGEVLEGDLWVLGRGAPDIVEEQLFLVARAVASDGFERVTGDLIVDDRYFDAERYGDGWPGGHQTEEAYHAPISALMANYAAVRVENEWHAVDDAALHFGERLRELLELSGVRLEGRVRYPDDSEATSVPDSPAFTADNARNDLPAELTLLHTIQSEPLGRLVLDLNKFSNNVVAELVLKTLGAMEYGPPGTSTKGLAVIAHFLDDQVKISLNSYVQADGSGLSPLNRFSPRQVVDLLSFAFNDFHVGPELVSSLKISGLDGWNPRPFRDPPLVGEMRVKSGHIRGVNTLTGYAHTQGGRTVAFCAMVNEHRTAQWQVDQRMAELSQAILSSY